MNEAPFLIWFNINFVINEMDPCDAKQWPSGFCVRLGIERV